jgi:hypothetical protein
MAKATREHSSLYFGTTEKVAKLAPVVGVNPSRKPVYLSAVYPGLFAFFAATHDKDRFGIIEIDLAVLDPSNFLPAEWYLEQTSRKKAKTGREHQRRLEVFRKELAKYKAKWKESLQKLGVCLYDGFIPKKAIRRITVYDPTANETITQAIVNAHISLPDYKKSLRQNRAVTRWLAGEIVTVEDWYGEEMANVSKDEREQLIERLQDKSGLDIFYYEPLGKGL